MRTVQGCSPPSSSRHEQMYKRALAMHWASMTYSQGARATAHLYHVVWCLVPNVLGITDDQRARH